MSDAIRVRVVTFSNRPNYMLQWTDPDTRKKKTKASKVERTGKKTALRDAEREAAELEKTLAEGRNAHGDRLSWQAFRTRYQREALPAKAKATANKVDAVFNVVESILSPQRLTSITADRLSYFQAELRRRHKSESTIKGCLAHLKSALRWAERVGLLAKAPRVDMPKRVSDKMKGRPITGEEFDRMLAKVDAGLALAWVDRKPSKDPAARKRSDKALANDQKRQAEHMAAIAPMFRRLLRGLWLSGLRLSEAMNLTWDNDHALRVDLSGRRPMLHIPAALDKGKKDRLLPITPDFAAMLLETPEAERVGHVFPLPVRRREDVGKRLTAIGKAALVKVGSRTKPGKDGQPVTVHKWASAHDLRRSFGERWAAKLMPQQLMELMRHESIVTTQTFYVGKNAERTADAVWAAFERSESQNGNDSGNTRPPVPSGSQVEKVQSLNQNSFAQ